MISMLKKVFIAQLLFCAVSVIAGQDVLLKGMVRDSLGSGVNQVTVKLKAFPLLSAKTNQDGSFTLSGNTSDGIITSGKNHVSLQRMYMTSDALMFTLSRGYKKLHINLYSNLGRLLSTKEYNNIMAGNYSLPLKGKRTACGLYYCSVIADDAVSTAAMCIVGSGIITGWSQPSSSTHDINQTSSALSSIIDTLLVFKQGYRNRFLELTQYKQENLACTVRVSNQWKPTGALVKNKNMVKILAKGYDFEMGQTVPSINDINTENELPMHTVFFTYDFWMDTTEVTQGQFDTIMKQAYPNEYTELPDWLNKFGMGKNYPTYSISWGGAALYANALSKLESLDTVYSYTGCDGTFGCICDLVDPKIDLSKNGYRLPTEAEWEYACRGGTATDFYWGKNIEGNYPLSSSDTTEVSNHIIWTVNSLDMGDGQPGFGTHPVASKTPNAYGLYDINGNVSEWCNDLYAGYSFGSVTDPAGPQSNDDNSRCQRGGNWTNGGVYQRTECRTFAGADYPNICWGLRIVKPIK